MHYYGFHPAKFNHETKHLDDMQELVYRRLIDEYMTSEQPLTTDFDKLAWRMRCKTDEMKQALQIVLDEFFVIKKLKATGDKEPMYHHERMDKDLKGYKFRNGNTNQTTSQLQTSTNATTNEVQTDTSDNTNKNATDIKKAFLINSLKNQGVKANTRMKISELQALFDEHCKQTTNEVQTDTNTNTNQVQTGTNDTNAILPTQNHNQEPVTKNQNKNKYQSEVLEVFEFWKSVFEKSEKAILSDKRKTKIIERLKDGYTVEQIKQAIYNCSKSEFHVLNNYTDLELICRNIEKLDYYLGLTEQIRANQTGNSVENQPVTPKLDPSQAILCNGLLKPLFPNMNQAQSWQFVNQNRQPYEGLDETYDRLMSDVDWQNFDYSKVAV